MPNNFFQFKQFRIEQGNSAMKVGIDSVMLGSWASAPNARNILDIGCGTGLLSLMLAQRNTSAIIVGVEIDNNAIVDAEANISSSKWKSRISITRSSFQSFAKQTQQKFDLIISNPPFFDGSNLPLNNSRIIARHDISLGMQELIDGSVELLSEDGVLSVIYPSDRIVSFIDYAKQKGLHANRLCKVFPNEKKASHRTMVEFTQNNIIALKEESLIIRNQDGKYSDEYNRLTSDFYLK